MATAASPAPSAEKKSGLDHWMSRVLEECDHASVDFAADPVHDLRVALRRCRSMADGLMAIVPEPAWKEMKKAGKRLFSSLGELRDIQVMQEWVNKLGSPHDPVTMALLQFLAPRELHHKQQAAQALHQFDRKQWKKWSAALPRRAARMRPGSLLFRHLALERWTEAHELHRQALRNRSQVAFHRLRIGLKRFRYMVENFLPAHHEAWIEDLKHLQDLLGEVHDLDVLWATALQVNAFPDHDSRVRWHKQILDERERRIQSYRDQMVGKNSRWPIWRSALPVGKQIEAAAFGRLKLWASFLDPDAKHSRQVSRLALQLFDGLPTPAKLSDAEKHAQRAVLQLAALLHEVGRSRKEKGHHRASYRLISKLHAPLGWTQEELRMAGVVARYHRGSLPRPGQKILAGLTSEQRQVAERLAGILRLANAFDADHRGKIHQLHVTAPDGFLRIAAQGYNWRDRTAEAVAASRHLLETIYRCPILVNPLRTSRGEV